MFFLHTPDHILQVLKKSCFVATILVSKPKYWMLVTSAAVFGSYGVYSFQNIRALFKDEINNHILIVPYPVVVWDPGRHHEKFSWRGSMYHLNAIVETADCDENIK